MRDLIIILAGRLGQAILAFLAIKLATFYLSPEEYGRLSLLVSFIAGFILLLISPVGLFINRRLNEWIKAYQIKNYFFWYAIYLLTICLIASLVIIFLQKTLDPIKNMDLSWIVVLSCLSFFFTTANQTFIPCFNLLNYRGHFVLLTLASLLLSLVLSALFSYLFVANAQYWQLGQILGQAIVAILAGVLFFSIFGKKQNHLTRPNPAGLKNLTIFSSPLILTVGLTWAQTQGYRFIVGEQLGLSALGLFAIGYGVSASLIAAFESVVTTLFLPNFYQGITTESKNYAKVWQAYAEGVLPGLLMTMAFIILFASEFAQILLAPRYQIASQYIIWGAIAEAGRVTLATYAYCAQALLRNHLLLIANFLGAALVISGVLIFVPLWGLSGLGLSLVLGSLVVTVMSHNVLARQIKIHLPWRMLSKAFIYAFGLASIVWVIRKMLHYPHDTKHAVLILGIFGILYLLLLYKLLHRMLQEDFKVNFIKRDEVLP